MKKFCICLLAILFYSCISKKVTCIDKDSLSNFIDRVDLLIVSEGEESTDYYLIKNLDKKILEILELKCDVTMEESCRKYVSYEFLYNNELVDFETKDNHWMNTCGLNKCNWGKLKKEIKSVQRSVFFIQEENHISFRDSLKNRGDIFYYEYKKAYLDIIFNYDDLKYTKDYRAKIINLITEKYNVARNDISALPEFDKFRVTILLTDELYNNFYKNGIQLEGFNILETKIKEKGFEFVVLK